MHKTSFALDDDIVPCSLAVRACLPITRDASVDKPRIYLATIFVPQSDLGEFPGDEVLHEDVRLRDELVNDVKAFGLLEVDGEGSLVAVCGKEVCGLGRTRLSWRRRNVRGRRRAPRPYGLLRK